MAPSTGNDFKGVITDYATIGAYLPYERPDRSPVYRSMKVNPLNITPDGFVLQQPAEPQLQQPNCSTFSRP
jgi:hypothetical protein